MKRFRKQEIEDLIVPDLKKNEGKILKRRVKRIIRADRRWGKYVTLWYTNHQLWIKSKKDASF